MRAWADEHLGASLALEFWKSSGRVDALSTRVMTDNFAVLTVGAVMRL